VASTAGTLAASVALIFTMGNAMDLRAEQITSQSGPIEAEHLAKLDNPWGITRLPDGRMLITEKTGQLRFFDNGKLSEPIKGLPKVEYNAQGGLLDVEIDPDFSKNGLVYWSYTEAADEQPKDAKDKRDPRLGEFFDDNDNVLKGTAVARGRLEGNELHDVQVIWRQFPKTIGRNHYGGRLVFSPDGHLFITSGERQRFEPAQDLGSTLGKVVRINPDGSIPKDNPFVATEGALPDIWSYGHRNPLGAAINPSSQQLWLNEMGPKGGDEVNIIEAGKNYGWPIVSDGDNYDDSPIPDHATPQEFQAPLRSWNPSISPSGMVFYTGGLFPEWRGNAILGGLSSEALIRLDLAGNEVTGEERIDMGKRVRDVMQDADGSLLVLIDGDDGELLRLTPGRRTSN